MAYLDKFIKFLHETIRKAKPDTYHSTTPYMYVDAALKFVSKTSVFKFSDAMPLTLTNIFLAKPPVIPDTSVEDLLNIQNEGRNRFKQFIRQHILSPPVETPSKLKFRKLATFSAKKITNRQQKTKVNQLSLLLRRAYGQVQKAGHYFPQTSEFPLAFCNEFGEMRERQKGKFKSVLNKSDIFKSMFTGKLPYTMEKGTTEVIIDFMKFLHMPISPHVTSYNDLITYYWDSIVMKLGFNRLASIVTLIFDKEKYLPPIRALIHSERKSKAKGGKSNKYWANVHIGDDIPVIRGADYVNALQCAQFKSRLIDYLSVKFESMASSLDSDKQLIIDSGAYDTNPMLINCLGASVMANRRNNKGEADYNIWFHAHTSPCNNILVIANDTDVFMYGLAQSQTQPPLAQDKIKQIAVELEFERSYVYINTGVGSFKDAHLNQLDVLALFLLGGSDYVSNIYGISYKLLLDTFIKYGSLISNICSGEHLVIIQNNKVTEISSRMFTYILTFVYLNKNKRLYAHIAQDAAQLYDILKRSGPNIQNTELVMILRWLGYGESDICCDHTEFDKWINLTRRVCYFSNSGPNLYKHLIPSLSAIQYHTLRGTYILKVAMETENPFSNLYTQFTEYGWQNNESGICILWDNNIDSVRKELTSKRRPPTYMCNCKANEATRCRVGGRGCKNCTKLCRPCTQKCGCKGQCANPHNVPGGSCPSCQTPSQSPVIAEPTSTLNALTSTSSDNSDESDTEDTFHLGTNDFLGVQDYNLYFNDEFDTFFDMGAFSSDVTLQPDP